MDSIVIYLAFISCSVIFTEKQIYKVFITTCKLVSVILKCSFDIKSIEKLLTYLIAAEYSIQIFLHHDVIVLFPVVDFLILSKTRKTLEH